jgi:hypothetical protein
MPCREHHCDGAAVGVSGNIRRRQTEHVHHRSDPVGGSFKAGVEPRHTLRLTHIEQIDSIDAGALRQKSDVLMPVPARSDETVQQEQRPAAARELVMHAGTRYLNEPVLNQAVANQTFGK